MKKLDKEEVSKEYDVADCSYGENEFFIKDSLRDDEYILVMKRLREAISDGLSLNSDDSTDIGNKHTHCSWGLCTNSADIWKEPTLHIWPNEFIERGRVAPRNKGKNHICHLKGEVSKRNRMCGCFYSCRVFQDDTNPSRDFVLNRIDELIARFEGKQNGYDLKCVQTR